MKKLALNKNLNGSFHFSDKHHEFFLGDGFFNTLNDISSIASTVGSVKSSLSGGSGGAATQTTSAYPSTNYELEKLKMQLLANENAMNTKGTKATDSNDNLLYVSMGVGGLILIAVLILALK
ncbi:hypothetical protein [Reichenbachiella sp. MALMAid0571]|uniref:hypothetical protein n=1 Tax=Reichenbachiella sp. MALMAid0571 TaxID=3143939 RepID=UPI0032DEB9B5